MPTTGVIVKIMGRGVKAMRVVGKDGGDQGELNGTKNGGMKINGKRIIHVCGYCASLTLWILV